MEDSKYVVFKRKDWNDFLSLLAVDENEQYAPPSVQDAVVIRRQDEFAPPALDAYANAILITCGGMREFLASVPMPLRSQLMADWDAKINRLREISGYFHDQAVLSWDAKRKLPD